MTTHTTPRTSFGSLSDIKQIDFGGQFLCALTEFGSVWCSGNAPSYEFLGTGCSSNNSYCSYAAQEVKGSGVIMIAAGNGFLCILKDDNTVGCSGSRTNGKLGDGTTSGTTYNGITVVKNTSNHTLSNITKIDAGSSHSCALHDNGSVSCWGYNYRGQIGDSTTSTATLAKIVPGLDNVKDLMVESDTSCALTNDYTTYCWGNNSQNMILNCSSAYCYSPTKLFTKDEFSEVTLGTDHMCELRKDKDTVKCWGANSYGQLGDQTNTNSTNPVNVIGLY